MCTLKNYKYRLNKSKGYSDYHARLASDPYRIILQEMEDKTDEMVSAFDRHKINTAIGHNEWAVLGAGDKRYIPLYYPMLEYVTGLNANITVYDLDITHLKNQKEVVQHDCRNKLPKKFDFVYSHILLNFMDYDDQLRLLINSYKSLEKNGIAIHVYADKTAVKNFIKNGYDLFEVDKPRLMKALENKDLNKNRIILQKSLFGG